MATTHPADFLLIARALSIECDRLGISRPAFRARPHNGHPRSIKRCPSGVVVIVRLDRDEHSVTSDLIDGCVLAARVTKDEAETLRASLWVAAGEAVAA